MPPETIRITLNGAPHTLPSGQNVLELLADLGIVREGVAVERNGSIVRRADQGDCPLCSGDRVEIVHFVGGG